MLIPCFTEIFPVVLSAADNDIDLYVTYEGTKTNEISLVRTEITEISAVSANIDVDAYRWQICYDIANNGWAYIYDKVGQTIEISRGLFETIADSEGSAYIRAVAETYFGRVYSAAVRVVLTEAPAPVAPELLPTYNPPKKIAFRSLLTFPASDVEYVNFTINYLSADNPDHHVYQSYTAKVAADAPFAKNVLSPTQIGFAAFYTGTQGVPQLADGESISVTLGDETRSYTYTDGAYVNDDNSEIEESSGWLNAINIAVIDSAADRSASVIPLSYTPDVDPVEDVVINVYYKAIEVPYSVKYYFQNVNDDGYTQNAAISYNGMAKTGTIVDNDTLYAPVLDYYGVVEGEDYGFSPLYHYPESVAADGSTVFECYYDRNYYLIKFDMDGGYGVEPIYARYGTSFVVTPPTKAGYVFKGWDEVTHYTFDIFATVNGSEVKVGSVSLTPAEYAVKGNPSAYMEDYDNGVTVYSDAIYRFRESHGNGVPDAATLSPNNLTGTMEARNLSYKAIWEQTNANVTVIYWKENANDDDYSYWGVDNANALSATCVDGETYKDLPVNSATFTRGSDYDQFYYDHADTNVFVNGDGTSVVNVYYKRKVYRITLMDQIPCQVPEHTHTDGCYGYLCGQHVHTANCLICSLPELPHTEECCSVTEHIHGASCQVVCTILEHTHTDSCYGCGLELHTHSSECCDKPEHTHDGTSCSYLICTLPIEQHNASCYGNCTHIHDPSCYGANTYTKYSSMTNAQKTGYTAVSNAYTTLTTGKMYVYTVRTNNGNRYDYTNYFYFYDGNDLYYIGNTSKTWVRDTGNTAPGTVGGLAWSGNLPNNSGTGVSTNTLNTNGKCTHTHDDSCLSCTHHTEHTDACYHCGHAPHEHTPACYPDATTTPATNQQTNGVPGNPAEGQIYRRSSFYNRIIYINGSWYQYSGSENSGTVISPDCGKTVHVHTAECCAIEAHRHGDGHCNYTCGKTEHPAHDVGCLICGYTQEHTHSELCQYTCEKIAHTHTSACCSLEEHTHLRECLQIGGYYRYNYQPLSLSNNFTEIQNVGKTSINGVDLYYDTQAGYGTQFLYVKLGSRYYRLEYNNGTPVQNTSTDKGRITTITITYGCGKTEHVHDGTGCNYICGYTEEHIHTDSCYICGIPQHIHGVDECNGDNCTDPTHHRHTEACYGCGYTSEHIHTDDCPRGLACGLSEHSHDDDGKSLSRGSYGNSGKSGSDNVIKIIEAKYGQDISNEWNFTTSGGYSYPQTSSVTSWYPNGSTIFSQRLITISEMPAESFILAHITTSNSKRYYNYYIECLPGEAADTSYNGKDYKHYYNSGTQTVDYNTYAVAEDFFDIPGFTRFRATRNGNTVNGDTSLSSGDTMNFYYTRDSYTLDIINEDGAVISSQSVLYQAPLASYVDSVVIDGEHNYPADFEPNAYSFDKWYQTPYKMKPYTGNEIMPASNMAFYASWLPVTHVVRFFETYDIMLEYEARAAAINADTSLDADEKAVAIEELDAELVYEKQSMPDVEYKRFVEHGSFVGSIPNPDKLLVENPGGSTSEYDFGVWFFIENEKKKAFTPLDMPITKELNVFADWGTHTAQPYAVHYALDESEIDSAWLALLPAAAAGYENKELSISAYSVNRTYICLNDGTEESPVYRWHRIISDMTRGYAYQGTTRTFAARAGDTHHQLYDAYDIDFNDKYYPTPASHSITMAYEEDSLEPINNVFTFRYVFVENVDYVVRYLDAVTGDELHSEKYVTTDKAVVTERFVPITDYVPDAFYKQCILAVVEDENNPGHYVSSPENVITFYYSQNDTSARYTVHFMLQKADDNAADLTDADYNVTFNEDGTYNFSNKFEESGSRIDGIADKDVPTEIIPVDFAGFSLVTGKTVSADGADSDDDYSINAAEDGVPFVNNTYTIVPDESGTDLFIFYTREHYKYRVYYLLYKTPVTPEDLAGYVTADTDDPKRVLADTDGISPELTALYGTDFTADAKDIPGYVCISSPTISKGITPIEENNYIIFFYIPEQYTVQYEVAGGVGGTLSNTIETFDNNETFSVGSAATADAGYDFVGWFVDEECTIPATFAETTNPDGKGTTYTDNTMTTEASGENGVFVYPVISRLIPNGQTGDDTNIFYAKFTPRTGDLTINRTNSVNEGNGHQTFVYEVRNNDTGDTVYVTITDGVAEDGTDTDSVTIHNLICGEYTVTQIADWSHRFDDDAQPVTLNTPTGTSVTFGDAAATQKWLNGNGSAAVNRKGAVDEE